MTKPRLTDWFDASVNPVHVGVYQRRNPLRVNGDPFYSKWSGAWWCIGSFNFNNASEEVHMSQWQHLEWRGLKEQT